jgi:integrase/recombinase XerD
MRNKTGKQSTSRRQAPVRFAKQVGDPKDSRGMYAAMRRYVSHRATLGSTPYSLRSLEYVLREFIDWADARAVTHPQQVSYAVLERYRRWIYFYRKKNGQPLAIGSQAAKLTPVKSFFKWLTRSGEIPANPASELEIPSRGAQLPKHVLTAAEVERVMAGVDVTQPLGLRDRAIMEVLYSTGMRRMEVINLHINDIDMERSVVLIREGKGRKDRWVPIGERALHWVQQYLEQVREQFVWNRQDMTLFLGVEGLPLGTTRLSELVKQNIKKAQLGKYGSCHLFRHTMATLMLEGGADIRFIQAMLGHADLSTTQIYTQVAIKQLQKVHTETHPGALRRVRGAETSADNIKPQLESENAAQTLFDALDAEAQADDEDGNADHE